MILPIEQNELNPRNVNTLAGPIAKFTLIIAHKTNDIIKPTHEFHMTVLDFSNVIYVLTIPYNFGHV